MSADRQVQRAMRTEMPLEEDCRNWPQFVREVMPLKAMLKHLLFSPIVIEIRPTLDITINAIVVAPQFWSLF